MKRGALSALLLLALSGAASPAADDPFLLLYAHGLSMGDDGEPLVTVRIDDGEEAMTVALRGPCRLIPRGDSAREIPAGTFSVRVVRGRAARLKHGVEVEEVAFQDKAGARDAAARWTARGFATHLEILGGAYGIRGRVLDTRRYAVVLAGSSRPSGARALAERVSARFGVRTEVVERLVQPPSGTVEVRDDQGRLLVSAPGMVTIEADAGAEVRGVEHDVGYDAHGREDRTYRGRIHLLVGPDGKLAAVNALPIEELLRGIVPAEIYATAPPAALEAQAVTARGEILAKIGARHLADPYALCGEQHCQVFRGRGGEQPATDAAIVATRGEVLLHPGGQLVDSVFSSTCGGHTEDNDAVWGGAPDPALRGVPDWDGHPAELAAFETSIASDGAVAAFLAATVPSMCSAASLSRSDKYRWERRFTLAELDRTLASLSLGHILSLEVTGRGSSGRATGLAVTGERGATVVKGELSIRRLLRNLNSSLFVIEREGPEGGAATGWVLRGGGWGHGVGMCQMGAIGRAEAGESHDEILHHYFQGAHLERLYGGKPAF